MGGDRRLHNQPLPPRRRARAARHADALPHRGRRLELLPRGAGDINAPGPPSARGARRSTNLRCGVPYIPTFPYDDSDSRRWFLCDSATSLLVAGVDTLGGREGEPWRAVRRSARSARRARSYRPAKLLYELG